VTNLNGPSNGSRTPDRIEIADALPESAHEAARRLRTQGDEALESGDPDAAAQAYHAAIASDPNSIRAHHNLGVALYANEDWEGARACFERCFELAPDDGDLRFKVGLCELKKVDLNKARRAFGEALELDDDHLGSRFELALLYARGDAPGSDGRQKAQEALKAILAAADRGVPCANLDRVCFLLGSLLDDTAKGRDEAIAIYRRGIEAEPLFAPGHNNLGVLLMQAGQTIPALGAFKIAIHLEPDYVLPYRNLARLLFDQMNPSQMERESTSIIEEFGAQSASVLSRLSLELIDLGRAQVFESLYTRGHQLKNLMGVVGSRMRRLIKGRTGDAPELDDLKEIAHEQERIYDQWVDYLRSMKHDSLNPTLVDIPVLARRTCETVGIRYVGDNLRFATEPDVPQVRADPAMLREAITNLVMNASEAIGEDGQVTVQTGYDSRRASVYIEVEDDGPGIPQAVQARIFDPGYSTKEKGNGYGLSICDRIVSAHRGNLRVISRPGAGAVFRIDLPVDFEITSGKDAIRLQGTPSQTPNGPLSEEFIE
jgi:signal transduction histidine kinase/Tfp pilus assembly protein PilF